MERAQFSAVDYTLFAGSLVVTAGIGVYYAFFAGQQTTRDVLLGNKQLGVLPIAMTLVASFISAISILGYPAEIYQYGTMFCWYALTYCVVYPATAFLYLPVFYKLHLTSAYEYLELRFDRKVRLTASFLFCLQIFFYMAVVLYAPALAISSVFNIPLYVSILTTGLLSTFYTSIGGARAVVWTSTLQVALIVGGMLAVIISGSIHLGGLSHVWSVADMGGRISFNDFRIDPRVRHSFWSLLFGGSGTVLTLYAANQMSIQRYLSMPTLRKAQMAVLINIPSNTLALVMYTLVGLIMYAAYVGCDPKTNQLISRADQLLPYYVIDKLGDLTGLPGLFLSAVYGAGLSTLAGGFNAVAAVIVVDFVKPFYHLYKGAHICDRKAATISKLVAFGFGIGCIGLAFVFTLVKSTVLQISLSIFGMVGGPLLGVFTLGMFFPCANAKGAICGLVLSVITTFWIGLGALVCKVAPVPLPVSTSECLASNMTSPMGINTTSLLQTDPISECSLIDLYRISYQYYSLVGILVLITVGLAVSFCTGSKDVKTVNPDLLVPIYNHLACCLPHKWKSIPHNVSSRLDVPLLNTTDMPEKQDGNGCTEDVVDTNGFTDITVRQRDFSERM